jgi:ribonuclease HII
MKFTSEKKLIKSGFNLIAGVDEAGRGPLAGPVVAACVCCYKEFFNKPPLTTREIKDSKQLSSKQRDGLYKFIIDNLTVGIGICDHKAVDKINILQATFRAMDKAVKALKVRPDIILVDGNKIVPQIRTKQQAIVDGDEKVFLISAASIIAKVTRDRLMAEYDLIYPLYKFGQHKGYGTKQHMLLLAKHGPCEIHRRSFAPIKSFFTPF